MKIQNGFTIIKLIVVIAIIAVLAAIVLINVTQYIGRGKDVSIKSNLNTIIKNGVVYFEENGTYYTDEGSQFFITSGFTSPATAADQVNGGTGVLYKTTNNHFCVCSLLITGSNDTYCVDDDGYKKQTQTSCTDRCIETTGACQD